MPANEFGLTKNQVEQFSKAMPQINCKKTFQDFRTRSSLEATRRLIAQQGFDAVTMERV